MVFEVASEFVVCGLLSTMEAAIGIEPMNKGFAGCSDYMLLSILQYHTP